MKHRAKTYILILLFIIAMGLPSRTIPKYFPYWYITYAGDFLWAMAVFFLYCLIFRLQNITTLFLALITAYSIEISQIFHPEYLEKLRSIKLFALILGFSFSWSDIIVYTLGIISGAVINSFIIKKY